MHCVVEVVHKICSGSFPWSLQAIVLCSVLLPQGLWTTLFCEGSRRIRRRMHFEVDVFSGVCCQMHLPVEDSHREGYRFALEKRFQRSLQANVLEVNV